MSKRICKILTFKDGNPPKKDHHVEYLVKIKGQDDLSIAVYYDGAWSQSDQDGMGIEVEDVEWWTELEGVFK